MKHLLAVVALTSLIAGAAYAQGGAVQPAPAAVANPRPITPAAPSTAAEPQAQAPSLPASVNASTTVTVVTVTNGPVPDTAENRAKYGGPMSHAGKHSTASGN